MVSIVCDTNGDCLFLLSNLSDHTRAIQARPQASVLVAEQSKDMDHTNLDRPRLTLRGSIETISRDHPDHHRVRQRSLALNREATRYVDFRDFDFYRLVVADGLYNAGFAQATRLQRSDLCLTLAPDFLREELSLVEEANTIKAESSNLHSLGAHPLSYAKVVALDPWGLDLEPGSNPGRIDFPKPMTSADEIRQFLAAPGSS